MKTCPICGAIAFDDAETCFGCLHAFAATEGEADQQARAQVAGAPFGRHGRTLGPDSVSFVLSLVPTSQPGGGFSWACTVEPARM